MKCLKISDGNFFLFYNFLLIFVNIKYYFYCTHKTEKILIQGMKSKHIYVSIVMIRTL